MGDLTSLWDYTKSDVLERVPDKNGKRLVGEHSCERYWIVMERIKRLVRSMAQQVDDVHKEGSCLSRFNHKNWDVTDTGLAVYKGLQLIDKTDQLIILNYDDLHSVILYTIFRKFTIQEIPADFKELLSLMKHRPLGNGYLIRNFAALFPMGNRILFFMKAFEHISFFLGSTDEDMKRRIMSKLPSSKRWFDILKGNYLLEYSFKYKARDDSGSPEGFMEYYRDSNYHRMDPCFQILEVGGYTAEEYEVIFIVKYPLYLTGMQEALHNEKQLEGLKPHMLFSFDPDVSKPPMTSSGS